MAVNSIPYNPTLLDDIKQNTPLGSGLVSQFNQYSLGTFQKFEETYTFTGLQNEPFILSASYSIPAGITANTTLNFQISVNGVVVYAESGLSATTGNPLYYNFSTGVIPTSTPTTIATIFSCATGQFFTSGVSNKASELVQIIQ
jgi:hypothetical protein